MRTTTAEEAPVACLISLTAFAVVWPNLITTQIPGCLDVTSLLVLRSVFSSPSYFGILVLVIDFLGFIEGAEEAPMRTMSHLLNVGVLGHRTSGDSWALASFACTGFSSAL
jgi:hypothetical protein